MKKKILSDEPLPGFGLQPLLRCFESQYSSSYPEERFFTDTGFTGIRDAGVDLKQHKNQWSPEAFEPSRRKTKSAATKPRVPEAFERGTVTVNVTITLELTISSTTSLAFTIITIDT